MERDLKYQKFWNYPFLRDCHLRCIRITGSSLSYIRESHTHWSRTCFFFFFFTSDESLEKENSRFNRSQRLELFPRKSNSKQTTSSMPEIVRVTRACGQERWQRNTKPLPPRLSFTHWMQPRPESKHERASATRRRTRDAIRPPRGRTLTCRAASHHTRSHLSPRPPPHTHTHETEITAHSPR